MARQPWLTRLALGRNAFEPLQESESESEPGSSENHHDDSDEPSRHAQEQNPVESELSDPDQCFTRLQPHVQQYDQRGYPTNPASEAHARQVRRAYNDVLASVGVVKRKDDEKKEAFATATQRAAELTEVENLVGSLVTATSFMGSFFSIWAFKNLRLRLAVGLTLLIIYNDGLI
ncbi:MAG: hypothetical protein M1820_008428 [Bogoriella megaspora]|nr:MAG: hypothetical protein M1820_008428 [Bogoriella megaspora]